MLVPGDVLHDIAGMEPELPVLDHVDHFDRSECVMRRVIDNVGHVGTAAAAASLSVTSTQSPGLRLDSPSDSPRPELPENSIFTPAAMFGGA